MLFRFALSNGFECDLRQSYRCTACCDSMTVYTVSYTVYTVSYTVYTVSYRTSSAPSRSAETEQSLFEPNLFRFSFDARVCGWLPVITERDWCQLYMLPECTSITDMGVFPFVLLSDSKPLPFKIEPSLFRFCIAETGVNCINRRRGQVSPIWMCSTGTASFTNAASCGLLRPC